VGATTVAAGSGADTTAAAAAGGVIPGVGLEVGSRVGSGVGSELLWLEDVKGGGAESGCSATTALGVGGVGTATLGLTGEESSASTATRVGSLVAAERGAVSAAAAGDSLDCSAGPPRRAGEDTRVLPACPGDSACDEELSDPEVVGVSARAGTSAML
jgi:hypothetical protein